MRLKRPGDVTSTCPGLREERKEARDGVGGARIPASVSAAIGKPVNGSMGSQWKNLADDLRVTIDDALMDSGLDPALWADVRMNVRLNLVDLAPAVP